MKKLNNKGFAITTLLYGLLSVAFLIMTLLMGIMSTNRQNTSVLVDRIEEELNRYGETETTFAFLGESQEYIVPYGQAGWYKIELWAASTSKGGGDYTSGIIYLPENTALYFYLGESCTTDAACQNVFNKGNTEVRIIPTGAGQWNDASSIRSTIMRAGGYDESYVSGMAGMNSVDEYGTVTNLTNHYTAKYFLNGLLMEEANLSSNGMANVEMVSATGPSNPPPKKVTTLDNVRYIRSCTDNGSTANCANHIIEFQAIDINSGINLAKGKTPTPSTVNSNNGAATNGVLDTSYSAYGCGNICVTIDLGGTYALSEVGVWNYYHDNRAYYNHRVSVSANGSTYVDLKKASGNYTTSVKESKIGHRYTAWQPDTTTTLPTGNYYIVSSEAPNKVLTAQNSRYVTDPSGANVTTETFKASKLQKWTIEPVDIYSTLVANPAAHTGTVYKIYEAENKNALQIQNGTAENGENACAKKPYRAYEWDLWYVEPMANGTYRIKSLMGTYLSTASTGTSPMNVVLKSHINSNTDFSQRWKIINAEY